jgi:hypothetical protein
VWANELSEGQEQPGGSVWVGDDSDTAKYCLDRVEIFQQALEILARKLARIARKIYNHRFRI